MARWKPDQTTVKQSEYLGRRIFSKSSQATVSYNIFIDTRVDDDLSLDRMGEGEPSVKVVEFLTPLGDEAGAAMGQMFHGWLAAPLKALKHTTVRPDALSREKDGVDNPYHALLDRSAVRDRTLAFFLSRHLFMAFKEEGREVRPARKPTSSVQSE